MMEHRKLFGQPHERREGAMREGTEQDLVQRLRHAAYKLGNWSRTILRAEPEQVSGNVLLYEQAANEIEQLRARLAEVEKERDGLATEFQTMCHGVNRRCGVGMNELPLVSVDRMVKQRDNLAMMCQRLAYACRGNPVAERATDLLRRMSLLRGPLRYDEAARAAGGEG
jgi:hypothetical protein